MKRVMSLALNTEVARVLALWSLLGPASLALIALVMWNEARRSRIARLAATATGINMVAAIVTASLALLAGPVESPTIGSEFVGFAARVDGLSATLHLLVGFVGLVVIRYSLSYLDGDPRQARFLSGLLLTLSAVSLLVLSGTLVQLMVGWIATSAGLHRMLLFYPERNSAQVAAKKKFIVARIGDLLLITACFLLAEVHGTTHIGTILERAAAATDSGELGSASTAAAVLMAIAALLKSAQFPTHGWLLEVMETPTPVSALLHAGIINAGGFLVLRFANLFMLESVSLDILVVVGASTALFGSLAMLCQSSVKVSLAYSTVAQMGFMLLECGLGAFGAALIHLVAHSLYKAHAFLASGSVVTAMRPLGAPVRRAGVARILTGLAASAGVVVAVAYFAGLREPSAAMVLLMTVVALSLSHFLIAASAEGAGPVPFVRALLLAAALSGVYLLLHVAGNEVLGGLIQNREASPLALAVASVAVAGFALVVLAQAGFGTEAGQSKLARAAYVLMKNDLYANTWMSRWVGAWKRPTRFHPTSHP